MGRHHGAAARAASGQRVQLGQQHGDSHAACLFDGGGHGGQRRIAEVRPENVITPHNAHVLWYTETPFTQPLQHPDGNQVVKRDAGRDAGVDSGVRCGRTRLGLGRERSKPADFHAEFLCRQARAAQRRVLDWDVVGPAM